MRTLIQSIMQLLLNDGLPLLLLRVETRVLVTRLWLALLFPLIKELGHIILLGGKGLFIVAELLAGILRLHSDGWQ